ncbi:MAG: RNA pyrophosphohydrolase [Alphaproteobacteria bacterium]|nr:RNA pyrophosphohydrolase [Alphaproteobacteria bacterium]
MQHEITTMSSGLPYRHSVGICLINDEGLVFCAERRDRHGAWQMPQGGIQKGEDPAVAVFREMKEEIGTDRAEIISRHAEPLCYEFPDYLQYRHGVFRGKYRGQEQIWFALRFLGDDSEFRLTNEFETELPEFINWKWMELAQTPDAIVEFKRPVYEQVALAFQPLVDSIRKTS